MNNIKDGVGNYPVFDIVHFYLLLLRKHTMNDTLYAYQRYNNTFKP